MTNNQLTDKSTIGARIAALLVADSVPLSDAWKALIDDAERTELQERRKAVEPIYQYRIRNGYNGQVTEWQTIRRDQVDFVLKAQPHNAEFQIIAAPQLLNDAAPAELQEHWKGSQALQDVAAERQRQISAEGWSTEHDDDHAPGQLSDAGGCYALNAFEDEKMREGYEPDWWPWERHWYKPGTPRRDLVKAAALIVAEIEHLDRVGSGVLMSNKLTTDHDLHDQLSRLAKQSAEESAQMAEWECHNAVAEPIYQLFDMGWYDTDKQTYDSVTGAGCAGRIVYAAPPRWVVPEDCPSAIRDLIASHSDALFNDGDAQEIWNACRASIYGAQENASI